MSPLLFTTLAFGASSPPATAADLGTAGLDGLPGRIDAEVVLLLHDLDSPLAEVLLVERSGSQPRVREVSLHTGEPVRAHRRRERSGCLPVGPPDAGPIGAVHPFREATSRVDDDETHLVIVPLEGDVAVLVPQRVGDTFEERELRKNGVLVRSSCTFENAGTRYVLERTGRDMRLCVSEEAEFKLVSVGVPN